MTDSKLSKPSETEEEYPKIRINSRGERYIEAEDLFRSPKVREQIKKLAQLDIKKR